MEDKPVLDIPPPVSSKDRLKVPFQWAAFMEIIQKLGNKVEALPILPFVDILFELTKMFKTLDITQKAELIDSHFRKRYSDKKTIQEICVIQRSEGVIRLNGENMKKEKIPKTHPYYKYSSVSRTIVRISWLFHFIIELTDRLLNEPEKKLSKIAKEAYKVTLGPHHPLLVREVASIAFLACPNRNKFLESFVGKEIDEEEKAKRLEMIKAGMKEVWEKVMKEITDNNYEKLP